MLIFYVCAGGVYPSGGGNAGLCWKRARARSTKAPTRWVLPAYTSDLLSKDVPI